MLDVEREHPDEREQDRHDGQHPRADHAHAGLPPGVAALPDSLTRVASDRGGACCGGLIEIERGSVVRPRSSVGLPSTRVRRHSDRSAMPWPLVMSAPRRMLARGDSRDLGCGLRGCSFLLSTGALVSSLPPPVLLGRLDHGFGQNRDSNGPRREFGWFAPRLGPWRPAPRAVRRTPTASSSAASVLYR